MSRKSFDIDITQKIEELKRRDKDSLSVAELLTLRAIERTAEIDLDGLVLKIRIPMQCEFVQYMEIRDQISKKILSGEDTTELMDQVFETLASWCLDESITLEFFRSGMFSMEDLGKIQDLILTGEVARIAAVKSFRPQ